MTTETLSTTAPLKMADIARMAGVSVSTVSRALAGSPLIPKPLRDKIAAIAEEHGYVVNQAARNLRLKRTRTIGLVLPEDGDRKLRDPHLLSMMGALTQAVFKRGYELLVLKTPAKRQGALKDLVRSQRFDGMLVLPDTAAKDQHEALSDLARYYAPLVVWGRLPDQSYCGVEASTATDENAEEMVDLLFQRLSEDEKAKAVK
ncbi:MAG: LacI family transcriptional regulator [Asticcacaulis sp.]|uniref:LacI family DNA-binding transcriptional regulator n=1 Tax=Asticcacaulis sp. TaxID=1872648 RepID=UPI0025BB6359|nr:LacI family DNA-binding transcriptional regulator [Asticcacaulis sp.]MCA1936010.1 LacI family transcriptional regulator [Asticcacaulis sp.]